MKAKKNKYYQPDNYFSGSVDAHAVLINLVRYCIRSRRSEVHRPWEFEMKNRRVLGFKDYAMSVSIDCENKSYNHFSKRQDSGPATESRLLHCASVASNKLNKQDLNSIKSFYVTIFMQVSKEESRAVCVSSKYCDKIFLNPNGVLVLDNQNQDFLDYYTVYSDIT